MKMYLPVMQMHGEIEITALAPATAVEHDAAMVLFKQIADDLRVSVANNDRPHWGLKFAMAYAEVLSGSAGNDALELVWRAAYGPEGSGKILYADTFDYHLSVVDFETPEGS